MLLGHLIALISNAHHFDFRSAASRNANCRIPFVKNPALVCLRSMAVIALERPEVIRNKPGLEPRSSAPGSSAVEQRRSHRPIEGSLINELSRERHLILRSDASGLSPLHDVNSQPIPAEPRGSKPRMENGLFFCTELASRAGYRPHPFGRRPPKPTPCYDREYGGARRDRTDDILLAKQALSQLSYGPIGNRTSEIRTIGFLSSDF